MLFYVRAVTPRRAVPLGVLALAELCGAGRRASRSRSSVRPAGVELPFEALQLGVLEPDALAHAYTSAAVGLCLSLTNPSLIPTEMMACGLPVVDVASDAMVATFGAGGAVPLAEPDPLALCDAIEGLLNDLMVRATRSRDGAELLAGRTWAAAAEQVEQGLRWRPPAANSGLQRCTYNHDRLHGELDDVPPDRVRGRVARLENGGTCCPGSSGQRRSSRRLALRALGDTGPFEDHKYHQILN